MAPLCHPLWLFESIKAIVIVRFLDDLTSSHINTQHTMSDAGRKNVTTKVTEAVKPESEKSYLEQGKESVTNAADSVAKNVTPDSEKSFLQRTGDSLSNEGETLTETAAHYVEAAKEQVANAAQYVSNVVTGAVEGGEDASKK